MTHEGVTRSPLSWPLGWKRTPASQRRRAAWGHRNGYVKQPLTVAQATDRLATELDRLRARDQVLSTNLALRLDGFPRSDQREPTDPGAAVYFTLNKQPRCLACDRWDRVADNIAALAAHVEALRAIDRWGVGTVEQAFRGYAALPEVSEVLPCPWWETLGVPPTAAAEQVNEAFRRLAQVHHPDKGGDHAVMARLSAARVAALREIEAR